MVRRLLAPRALRLPVLALALAVACLAPAGCGGSGVEASDRPLLVSSNPADGQQVATGLSAVRLTFDEPIRLFLSYQLQILRDGFLVPGFVFGLESAPDSLGVVLAGGETFSTGQYELRVNEGLVINADEQYALEPQIVRFEVGGAPAFFVGSPVTDHVTALDPVTLAPISSTPTPGLRDPVGVLAQRQGALTRVFVQLADGGGVGEALAHYVPGSAFMTPVTLTTSGGDLTSAFPALGLDRSGASLFVAYRDTTSQQVRLARVRTSDGVETGSLLLSIPAAADTLPTALQVKRDDPVTVLVTARSGGLGYVASVDVETFTEIDRDEILPGVQPYALGAAAGPSALAGDTLLVAPLGAATADLTVLTVSDGTVTPQPSIQPGTPTCLKVGYDAQIALEGLIAGPANEPLALRALADLSVVTPVDVTDDVGGVDQATTRVHALGQVPGQRRAYVLLDASCLARFAWDGTNVTQEDLDPLTLGVQVVKLVGDAAGATSIGIVEGSLP